jgi:hypothetical protein
VVDTSPPTEGMSAIDCLRTCATWAGHAQATVTFNSEQAAALLSEIERLREIESCGDLLRIAPEPGAKLTAEQVEWVVNDIAELGVKIGNQFFFLYKGGSLVYEDSKHDNGAPMRWRPVFKREFGECCHPVNYGDLRACGYDHRIGTVDPGDSDEWQDLPQPPTKAAAEPGERVVLLEAGLRRLIAAFRRRGEGTFGKEITSAEDLLQQPRLCEDCPPRGYPTDKTRCEPCPRREQPETKGDGL